MKKSNVANKIYAVQSEIKKLIRSEENKYQKYKYFDELQVLGLLKPLLKQNKLTLIFSDDDSVPLELQKDGSQYLVKYLKKLQIISAEGEEVVDKTNVVNQQVIKSDSIEIKFWAVGWNNDPAKAKGAAETYAIKYILAKLFLIPVKDESDPDTGVNQARIVHEDKKTADTLLKKHGLSNETAKTIVSQEQQDKIYKLFVEARGSDAEKQKMFFAELDKIMVKKGNGGATNVANFRIRIPLLTDEEYKDYWNFLESHKN